MMDFACDDCGKIIGQSTVPISNGGLCLDCSMKRKAIPDAVTGKWFTLTFGTDGICTVRIEVVTEGKITTYREKEVSLDSLTFSEKQQLKAIRDKLVAL